MQVLLSLAIVEVATNDSRRTEVEVVIVAIRRSVVEILLVILSQCAK